MLMHNNVFTHMWLEHFVGKFLKENEKWKKNLQTNMLWTYGLGCCVTWQIAPNTLYDVVTFCTCTLPLKMLLLHFWCILKYFVGMKLFGMDQWQWLLLVLEVLSSKALWLKSINMCIKSKQIIWMLKHKIVVRNFWNFLKVRCL